MQEQVNEKTVALSVKGAKFTGRMLARAMQAFLKRAREPTFKHGKQSIKSLTKQGASLTNVDITSNNIGAFNRVARKYNVDFALKRDVGANPPRFVVFFKSKDGAALDSAFKEFLKIDLKQKNKPSLLDKLNIFKELAKSVAAPVKNRSHGER